MSAAKLVWLVSYPKSGNTWIRLLLATLIAGGIRPKLSTIGNQSPNSAAFGWLESIVDLPTGLLSRPEQRAIRAEAYRLLAAKQDHSYRWLKVHDRFASQLFPAEVTDRIVYIARDPRDVAPSWADHLDVSLDTAIANMNCPGFLLSQPGIEHRSQAEQILGSWSEHVRSWIEDQQRPLLVIRYEDILGDTAAVLRQVSNFLNIACDDTTITATVEACRFATVARAEREEGFNERLAHQARFFRQGRSGQWRDSLDATQILALEQAHGQTMARFGYGLSSGSD